MDEQEGWRGRGKTWGREGEEGRRGSESVGDVCWGEGEGGGGVSECIGWSGAPPFIFRLAAQPIIAGRSSTSLLSVHR